VEDDLPKTLLAELQQRFPEVSDSVLNNASHHLRMRFFAARLARFRRLSLAAIRSAPPDDSLRHAVTAAKPPLADAPAIDGLVTLVKAAAPGCSLLGPLTAQFAHGTAVDPRWKDPWTFPRYVGELWSWISALQCEELEDRENSSLDAALREIRSSGEWEALASQLAQAVDQESVDALVETQSFDGPRETARRALARALGPGTLEPFAKAKIKRWREALGTGKSYWMVPVWYLTVVERLDQAAVLERLVVDRHEVQSVVALHLRIAADCLPVGHGSN
jgi:hypothetical protein